MINIGFKIPGSLLLLALLAGLLSPVSAGAQASSSSANTDLSDFSYTSETPPENLFLLDLNGVTAYDDNVFGNNQHRANDEIFEGGGRLGLHETRPRFNFNLDYRPEAIVYRKVQGFNQLNHAARAETALRLTRHFTLRATDSTTYTTSIFQTLPNEGFRSTYGVPPTLNKTVFTPLSRQLSNQVQVEAVDQFSWRNYLHLSGGFENRNFSKGGSATLFNTQGASGSLGLQHLVGQSNSVSLTYLYQNLRYGPAARTQIHSALLGVSWQISPWLNLNVFGGPQYEELRQTFGFKAPTTSGSIPFNVNGQQWSGAGGGALTWRTPRTVVQFSAQRSVTDGGGLLTSVTNTFENLDVRRHLLRTWDVVLRGDDARSRALLHSFGDGVVREQTAGLAFEHRFSNRLTAQLGYTFIRQRTQGQVPFLADMDRNYVSLSVFYQVMRAPLGQ